MVWRRIDNASRPMSVVDRRQRRALWQLTVALCDAMRWPICRTVLARLLQRVCGSPNLATPRRVLRNRVRGLVVLVLVLSRADGRSGVARRDPKARPKEQAGAGGAPPRYRDRDARILFAALLERTTLGTKPCGSND